MSLIVSRTVDLALIGEQFTQQAIAWQISIAGAIDLVTAINVIGPYGYTPNITRDPGSGVWAFTISKPGFQTQSAGQYDWIVFDGTYATVLSNDDFTATWIPTVAATGSAAGFGELITPVG